MDGPEGLPTEGMDSVQTGGRLEREEEVERRAAVSEVKVKVGYANGRKERIGPLKLHLFVSLFNKPGDL